MAKTFFGADGIALKPEEFRLMRDLFSARTGLHFGPEARFALERRLRERLAVLNLSSFSEYYHYLRFNSRAEEEWDEAVDLVTTNETYFFREGQQLRAFRDEILPMLADQAKARRRVAVWCAGCSTGEEVYTVAILLHQAGLFGQHDVRVYGSDISRRCIAVARRAVYGPGAFRVTPPDVKRAYFVERAPRKLERSGKAADDPIRVERPPSGGMRAASPAAPADADGGGLQVIESIRDKCHFGQMNLLHEDRTKVLGRADAIFCRNVLIYFDAHARRRVIDMFLERLYPGGVLLLGHSESLLNVSTAFELLHLREDLVYRKPLGQYRDPTSFPNPPGTPPGGGKISE